MIKSGPKIIMPTIRAIIAKPTTTPLVMTHLLKN
jgi:hypothetical protein